MKLLTYDLFQERLKGALGLRTEEQLNSAMHTASDRALVAKFLMGHCESPRATVHDVVLRSDTVSDLYAEYLRLVVDRSVALNPHDRFTGQTRNDRLERIPAPGLGLSTSTVALRSLQLSDFDFLADLDGRGELFPEASLASIGQDPRALPDRLFAGSLVMFVVVDAATVERVGIVGLRLPDFRSGYAYLVVLHLHQQFEPTMAEALGLLVDFAFQRWDFRKLYFEQCDQDSRAYLPSALTPDFELEVRLKDHYRIARRTRDHLIWSLDQSHWTSKSN